MNEKSKFGAMMVTEAELLRDHPPNTPMKGHSGPCANAADGCWWLCDKCEGRDVEKTEEIEENA